MMVRLGMTLLLLSANSLYALDFDDSCPGATDVVMSRGICTPSLTCALAEDGLPQVQVRSCTSGNDVSALKTCFKSGDPCFYIHSASYKANSQCASVQSPSGSDVLAASIPCKSF